MTALTQAQLDMRRKGITSTDVPAILGLFPDTWGRNAWSVYNAKVLGIDGDGPSDERSWVGERVEDYVLIPWYERRYRVCSLPSPGTIVGREPWMMATPDRFDPLFSRCIEIKAVGARVMYDWGDGATDIPVYVAAQCAWHMAVGNFRDCSVIALIGGTDIKEYILTRDLELEDRIIAKMRDWWHSHCVGEQTAPPEIDGTGACREYLLAKYPPREKLVQMAPTDEAEKLAQRRIALVNSSAKAESEVAGIDSRLCEILGAGKSDKMKGAGWSFRWAPTKSSGGKRQQLFRRDKVR